MDPHQSTGLQPEESISKVKVKRSSAWITRVINCKQSNEDEVSHNVIARVKHLSLEAFQDSGG